MRLASNRLPKLTEKRHLTQPYHATEYLLQSKLSCIFNNISEPVPLGQPFLMLVGGEYPFMDISPTPSQLYIVKITAVPTWTKLRQGREAHKQTQLSQRSVFISALQIHKVLIRKIGFSIPYAHVNPHCIGAIIQPYEVFGKCFLSIYCRLGGL